MDTPREEFQLAEKLDEELANLLSEGPGNTISYAAEAELRLREHRAILGQAAAAERAANATIRYTRYTFWIVSLTALIAAAALIGLRQALRTDRDSPAGPVAPAARLHHQL